MRCFFIFILLLMSNFSFSQDTICIPQNELNQFIGAVEDLEHQDSLKTPKPKKEKVAPNEQIKIYDDRLKKVDKWYKKPWVGFIAGTFTTIFTIHIIHYTLP